MRPGEPQQQLLQSPGGMRRRIRGLLPTALPPCPCSLQYLVQEVARRVFLVADGGMRLLEGGVAEYVQQLSGGRGKKGGANAPAKAGRR